MKRLPDYSQHFLRSPALIKELVGHSNLRKNDTVVDIGAGSGAITAVLAQRTKRVIAVEAEPRMARKLRDNMKRYENVTVVEADFLSTPLPAEPYKVFANIPFHISAAIVRKLVFGGRQPRAAYLIVQKQFANKLLMGRSSFIGQLGAEIAPWMEARIRRPLRRTDYWPHPHVDTVLLELQPRQVSLLPIEQAPIFSKMVAASYHDVRYFRQISRHLTGIDETITASQLRVDQWIELFRDWQAADES